MRCTHGCPSWNTSRAHGARYAPPEALEFRLSRLLPVSTNPVLGAGENRRDRRGLLFSG